MGNWLLWPCCPPSNQQHCHMRVRTKEVFYRVDCQFIAAWRKTISPLGKAVISRSLSNYVLLAGTQCVCVSTHTHNIQAWIKHTEGIIFDWWLCYRRITATCSWNRSIEAMDKLFSGTFWQNYYLFYFMLLKLLFDQEILTGI